MELSEKASNIDNFYHVYDKIIYLKGDSKINLDRAKNCKQEFAKGDVIENQGMELMTKVETNMNKYLNSFNNMTIDVDNKDIETVFNEIIAELGV